MSELEKLAKMLNTKIRSWDDSVVYKNYQMHSMINGTYIEVRDLSRDIGHGVGKIVFNGTADEVMDFLKKEKALASSSNVFIYKNRKITASCKEEAIKQIVAAANVTQLYCVEWKDKNGDRYKEYYGLKDANKKKKELEERDDIEWSSGPIKNINVPKIQELIKKYNTFNNKVKKNYDLGKVSDFVYNPNTANSVKWEDDVLNDGIFWIDNFSAGILTDVNYTSKKVLLVVPCNDTILPFMLNKWKDIATKLGLNVKLERSFNIGNGIRWSGALIFSNK